MRPFFQRAIRHPSVVAFSLNQGPRGQSSTKPTRFMLNGCPQCEAYVALLSDHTRRPGALRSIVDNNGEFHCQTQDLSTIAQSRNMVDPAYRPISTQPPSDFRLSFSRLSLHSAFDARAFQMLLGRLPISNCSSPAVILCRLWFISLIVRPVEGKISRAHTRLFMHNRLPQHFVLVSLSLIALNRMAAISLLC